MARCNGCGSILFGGVKKHGSTYCTDQCYRKDIEAPLVQDISGKLAKVVSRATDGVSAVFVTETAPGCALVGTQSRLFVAKAGTFSQSLSGFENEHLVSLKCFGKALNVNSIKVTGNSGGDNEAIDFLVLAERVPVLQRALERLQIAYPNLEVSLQPETPQTPKLDVPFADDAIRFGTVDKSNVIEAIQNGILDGDRVHALVSGPGQHLIVTDRHVIIIKTGTSASGATFFAASHIKSKAFPFRSITAIENSWGNITGRFQLSVPGCPELPGNLSPVDMKVQTAENVVTYGEHQKEVMVEVTRLARKLHDAAFGAATPTPAVLEQASTSDIPDQILKLASLKDAGILTEDEFQAKKLELLSRM